MRTSVERHTLEISEVRIMLPMKKAAILMPSGRAMMFTAVVYMNTPVIAPKAITPHSEPRCRTDNVTARAAELISTSTPVAYAPPCASTLASKMAVMTQATAV